MTDRFDGTADAADAADATATRTTDATPERRRIPTEGREGSSCSCSSSSGHINNNGCDENGGGGGVAAAGTTTAATAAIAATAAAAAANTLTRDDSERNSIGNNDDDDNDHGGNGDDKCKLHRGLQILASTSVNDRRKAPPSSSSAQEDADADAADRTAGTGKRKAAASCASAPPKKATTTTGQRGAPTRRAYSIFTKISLVRLYLENFVPQYSNNSNSSDRSSAGTRPVPSDADMQRRFLSTVRTSYPPSILQLQFGMEDTSDIPPAQTFKKWMLDPTLGGLVRQHQLSESRQQKHPHQQQDENHHHQRKRRRRRHLQGIAAGGDDDNESSAVVASNGTDDTAERGGRDDGPSHCPRSIGAAAAAVPPSTPHNVDVHDENADGGGEGTADVGVLYLDARKRYRTGHHPDVERLLMEHMATTGERLPRKLKERALAIHEELRATTAASDTGASTRTTDAGDGATAGLGVPPPSDRPFKASYNWIQTVMERYRQSELGNIMVSSSSSPSPSSTTRYHNNNINNNRSSAMAASPSPSIYDHHHLAFQQPRAPPAPQHPLYQSTSPAPQDPTAAAAIPLCGPPYPTILHPQQSHHQQQQPQQQPQQPQYTPLRPPPTAARTTSNADGGCGDGDNGRPISFPRAMQHLQALQEFAEQRRSVPLKRSLAHVGLALNRLRGQHGCGRRGGRTNDDGGRSNRVGKGRRGADGVGGASKQNGVGGRQQKQQQAADQDQHDESVPAGRNDDCRVLDGVSNKELGGVTVEGNNEVRYPHTMPA